MNKTFVGSNDGMLTNKKTKKQKNKKTKKQKNKKQKNHHKIMILSTNLYCVQEMI